MSTSAFVTHLRELGVKVSVVGGNLDVRVRGDLSEELRRELAARKQELLTLLADGSDADTITREAGDDDACLSFAQQRLWFMDQLEGASAAYNVPVQLDLRGPLDGDALARGLAAIVERHEVLRTALHAVDDRPRQVVRHDARPDARTIDLRGLPADERAAEVLRHGALEADTPFDLARGLLLRYRLLRCDDAHHVLLLTTHHIASDAWSMSLLIRELAAFYAAFVAGRTPDLPALPIQYRDFARWQRRQASARQLDYWRAQLRTPLPRPLPPLDHPRPVGVDRRGALVTCALPTGLTLALRGVAGSAGASMFMLLGAALGVVLARRGDQHEVIFGMPVAGRSRVEVEPLIGFFLNQLPLRVDLGGDPEFAEVLARVRRATLDALANQDVPFDRMVEEVRPERIEGQHPIFEVMLNMINTPALELSLAGLSVATREQEAQSAKYALTLHVRDEGGDLALTLGYQVALFSRQTIAVMLDQIVAVLVQVARTPALPVARLSLVTADTAALVVDLRAPLAEPHEPPVTAQIAAQVRAAPGRPAIVQGGRTWTYGQLGAQAEGLAHGLRARGLATGDVVAIDGRRSFGVIVGMLGALLAGGVFLNLDPNYPSERLAVMLRESRARFVVHVGSAARDKRWEGVRQLELDPTSGVLVEPPGSVAGTLPEVAARDDAYVFFTSGSTGVPNAVLGWHGALAHFCGWYRGLLGVTPDDRVSQLAGLSFDGFLKDVFLALTSGATLCLPDDEQAQDGPGLLRWLAAERVSIVSTVPSRVQAWLYEVPPGLMLPHVRWLNFAGEPLHERLIRRWRAAFPGSTRIMNFYGATEVTVLNCFHEVPDPAPPGIQCVGHARPDTQVFVMRDGRVCGVDEVGEVVLRSPFCTRGYLNDAALTAARFVQNPARVDPRDRLYRTGDRGRLRPDGTVQVFGRVDDQLKVRGVRVELGEVKSCLAGFPGVAECEVVPRKRELLDDLVAYVVLESGATFEPERLREYVAARLPAAMVPGALVRLSALPLTPNGKVDRAALPDPERPPERPHRPAGTPTERALVELWSGLLAVPSVGIDDGFFDIGGHSLLATQIVSRVRTLFGVELAVRTFFVEPTIARLAARIDLLRQLRDAPPEPEDDADERERGLL